MPRKIVKSKIFIEDEEVETLAEVPTSEPAAWGPDADLKVVGKPLPRIDGYDKVSGSAVYTSDVILPNMAHARTLRSPHAHARIKRIDTAEAEKIPGVLAILSSANAPDIGWYGNTSNLFDKHLRYEGDEVACVAAETEKIAEEALSRIKVKYEILPHVVDAGKAMQDDAPKLHENSNVVRGQPAEYSRGDVDAGFAEADAIVEDTYTTQVALHNTIEGHCSVVEWHGDDLTVWDSTQYVFGVRDTVANSLGIPASSVRVIKRYMGGGFGSKLETGKYTVMAALLARDIGRPVRIALDRREVNLAVGNRPDSVQTLKVGAKKDGTLTAMTLKSHGAVGAYPTGAGCSWPFRTMYRCPNQRTEEYSVFINAGKARPMRAPGHVQGTFALDSIIDDVAEKIGMDPLEFRIKNHVDRDQVMDLPYTSKRLLDAYEQGAKAIGWDRRNKKPGSSEGPKKRGIGMASQIWWGGGGPPAGAMIKLNRDGSARVLAGTQDLGTGTYTILAQVAAEVLEIPMEKIQVIIGDTATCPWCNLSGGSLTAPSVTPAVRDAAEQMKAKLMSGAAAVLELPEDKLAYAGGVITAKDDSEKTASIAEVIGRLNERVLVTTGARGPNPEGYAINTFGAQFADVEVDIDSGEVKVLKLVAAHDVGRVINQKTLENQIFGGVTMGLGFALMEERVMDERTGKSLTTHIHTYKVPTIKDIPEIVPIIVSDSDPMISPVGAKGVGEPPVIPTAGAIANAIYNAIGVRVKSLPMTPDKVLAALYG
ncbi:MAG: xanthine dehydrogenase family protein molybdopterin-binding subunit [Planctomycetota bacterium]|jgi:xanthine dehydrogenase YagR molybdenum-binding subunit